MLVPRHQWRNGLFICMVAVAGGCLGLRVASVSGTKLAAGDSVVPTPEFIAAAMRNQALATVEVTYASVGGSATSHYIRTSEALSLTKAYTDSSDVDRASYDFAARETRRLHTHSNGANSGASQSPWFGDPFATLSLHDPVLFVLPWGTDGPRPLYEWIPSGQVVGDKEDIDGHPCWRIDIDQPVDGMARYSIWADPDAGFCPRQIVMTGVDPSKAPTIVSFQDYRELCPGVWFPMKHVNHYLAMVVPEKIVLGGPPPKPAGEMEQRTSTFVASEATSGKTFSKDSLLVHFPSGTKLLVNSTTQAVTVP